MQSLDDFIADLRSDVDKFEADYKRQAALTPEKYPLTFGEGNEGMWYEMFFSFIETGEA